MKLAYVDTSCLVAIVFDEPGAKRLAARLERFDRLFSSNLLEAELRSALVREGLGEEKPAVLSWISWIFPERSLAGEMDRILRHGHVKGADLWHLANALYLDPSAKELAFLTLDRRQKTLAGKLGLHG